MSISLTRYINTAPSVITVWVVVGVQVAGKTAHICLGIFAPTKRDVQIDVFIVWNT